MMLDDRLAIEDCPFFKQLVALPFVEAIYLHGSRARGKYSDNSDLDLSIECPMASDSDWEAVLNITRNAALLVRVDVIRLDQVRDPLHRNVLLQERKLLFLRDIGGEDVIMRAQMNFFITWHKKLNDWLSILEKNVALHSDSSNQAAKVIQTFQYSFNCVWVIARKNLSVHGMRTNSPLVTFREAYMEGWISNRPLWEKMIGDYHDSHEPGAEADITGLLARLSEYIPAMREAGYAMMDIIRPYSYLSETRE
jgi:uncharacterized protein